MYGVIVAKHKTTAKYEFEGTLEEFFQALLEDLEKYFYVAYFPWSSWKEVMVDDPMLRVLEEVGYFFEPYEVAFKRRYESYHFTYTLPKKVGIRSFAPSLTEEQKKYVESLGINIIELRDIDLPLGTLRLDFRELIDKNRIKIIYEYQRIKKVRGFEVEEKMYKEATLSWSRVKELKDLFEFTVEVFKKLQES